MPGLFAVSCIKPARRTADMASERAGVRVSGATFDSRKTLRPRSLPPLVNLSMPLPMPPPPPPPHLSDDHNHNRRQTERASEAPSLLFSQHNIHPFAASSI